MWGWTNGNLDGMILPPGGGFCECSCQVQWLSSLLPSDSVVLGLKNGPAAACLGCRCNESSIGSPIKQIILTCHFTPNKTNRHIGKIPVVTSYFCKPGFIFKFLYKRPRVWKHLTLSRITGNGCVHDFCAGLQAHTRACSRYIDNLQNFTNNPVVYVSLPILQMEKLRHTEVKTCPESHKID